MFNRKDYKEKQLRYSIRKVSFGAASVVISALYLLMGNAAVSASEVQAVNGEQNTVTNKEEAKKNEKRTEETESKKGETLDKTSLTKLIEEIEGKFAKGTYANKTEESVNQLKTALDEAKSVLNNAKTQAELTQAHANLIVATTKLQTKPEEKKEAPAVDTTNGKATVGKKATNTEKASNSNSIANSGSRDERNGKEMDKNTPFRTDAATTDTHANNEAGVSIINGNFEEGTVKPTGNEKIVTNDASNVVGWKVVDSKQTEIPIANSSKRLAWVTAGSIDWNHPYGVVMAGYRSLKTGNNPGTDKVDTIGKIYQDIKVTPGSEVLVKYRTTSFGNGYGFSTVKMTVKNPDTGEVYYTGKPNELSGFSDGLAFINVPKNVTKIRLEFEDADNFTHSHQDYDDSFISKNGTKLYPGGILSNVRVNTGAYVVAKDNQTKYEVTSSSRDVTTTSKEITVKVENKGWESTDSGVKYKVDLPQGVTVTYNGKTYSEKMELDLGSIGDKKEKTFKYTVNIPAGTPSITNLVGRVEYKTWQNSQAVPYGETKTGVVPIPDQNVELKMFKTELETAVAGAANLNQNKYTPESWKKFQDEITKAREILNEEQKNVPVNKRKSQSEINKQVDLLRAKQNSLTIAATTTEKNNLSAKVAELTKASTENKTPKSIDKYNEEFKKFEQDYNSIKTEVSNIIAKGNNATKAEVDMALSKVAEIKRKLDTAAGLLVDKGNKTELEKAVREESTVKGNFKYYNADKTKRDAYDSAITKGNTVINDQNATQDQVDAALRAITEAKAALTGAATDKAQLMNNNDVLNDLIQEDPTKGKTKATIDEYKKVKEESEKLLKEIKKVIDNKNASQIEVNKALEMAIKAKDSLENAKKSLLDAVEAREVVETLANEKIVSIKADKKLYVQEKEKSIDRVERLKKKALEEIDKSKKQIEIDKALRTFLYQMDQDTLVFDLPELKVEEALQASVTGTVIAERGEAIRQADIIAKLNLPESVTVISVDLPDTNTLGRTFAKVTLRLPDGTEATVFVPVEVVESSKEDKQQNNTQEDSKPKVVPSNNSEQPTVTQTEDVKENPSNTSQESKASNQKVLPNTGTGNEISIFGSVAMTVLASLGLVATSKKKEEE